MKKRLESGQYVALVLIMYVVMSGVGCTHAKSEQLTSSSSPVAASAQTTTRETAIVPGSRVGPLELGSSKQQLKNVFSWKAKYDEDYTHEAPCYFEEVHWLDLETHSNGIFAYLRHDEIFQIVVETPRFSTAEGIKIGTTPENVRKHYPESKAFILTNSGMEVYGGKDVTFLVDATRGIAFGFYYDRRLRARRLQRISVFRPNDNFFPDGCVQEPQEWHAFPGFGTDKEH